MRRPLRAKPLRAIRLATQVGALLLLGKWALIRLVYCPFAVPFVFCRVCPVLDCPGKWLQPVAGWAILGSGLLFGRAFCGWLCPLGLFGDLLRRLPKLDLSKPRKAGRSAGGFLSSSSGHSLSSFFSSTPWAIRGYWWP